MLFKHSNTQIFGGRGEECKWAKDFRNIQCPSSRKFWKWQM